MGFDDLGFFDLDLLRAIFFWYFNLDFSIMDFYLGMT